MPEQMMDEFDRWAMRIFKAAAVLFIPILSLLAISMCVDNGDTMRPPVIQPGEAEKRWIEQRHKFHGIWISIEEPGVNPYFYRDGKKCKL